MSLINNIGGSLIANLGGGNSSSSASGSSTINGRGVSATFGGDRVSIQTALAAGKQAFTNSFLRTNDAYSKFQITQHAVGNLLAITDELIDFAERAADPQSTAQERSRLNSQFKIKRKEFKSILNDTQMSGVDLLDKSQLAGVLKDAGIDPEAASFLAQTFRSIAGSDDVVGFARLVSKPLEGSVIITGTEEIIVPGTATRSQITDEISTGGSTITRGQVLGTSVTPGSSLFNTTANYGNNPDGLYVIQPGSLSGVPGDGAIASYDESIEMLAHADNGVAIAIVGDGANSRLELYDVDTGDAVGSALEIGSEATLTSRDAAIDDTGLNFVYETATGLAYGDTVNYTTFGSLNQLTGTIAGGLDAAEKGFIFVSSDVDFGGDGSTLDLFYVDGFGPGASITNITQGNYGDIDPANVAIANDGSRIFFADNTDSPLYAYDVSNQTITNIGGVQVSGGIAVNKTGSALAVAEVGSDGDTSIALYTYDPVGAGLTRVSTADLNLGNTANIIRDLSINDAGDAVAFSVSGSAVEGKDEVFIVSSDVGGGTSATTLDIAGITYTFDLEDAQIIRSAELTENGGATDIERVFIERAKNNQVNFSSVANLGSNADGLSVVTISAGSLGIIGLRQETTNQENFQYLASSSVGSKAVTVKELEDGSYKIDYFDLLNRQVITSLAVTSEDPFLEASEITASVSPNGNGLVIHGIGPATEGADKLLFLDGEYSITTGNFASVELSNFNTALFTNATEFGADGSSYELIVSNDITAEALSQEQAGGTYSRYSLSNRGEFDTSLLAVSVQGNLVATATRDGNLVLVDTNTDEVLEIAEISNVQDVAVSGDGSRVAVLSGTGEDQTVSVYQITNAPGTEALEYDLLFSQSLSGFSLEQLSINRNGTTVGAVGLDVSQTVQELYIFQSDENFYGDFQGTKTVEQPVEPEAGSDPLNQDLSTIGGARIALRTLTALRDDIVGDLAKVDSIVSELRGAVEFALAGARAFESAASRSEVSSPERLASDIASQIRSATADPFLGAHSSLDLLLAKQLLG